MRCHLLYLIPGAILGSKFNYSDVYLNHFHFFFIEKIFKNGKYTVQMRTYSPGKNLLPLYAPVRFRDDSFMRSERSLTRSTFVHGAITHQKSQQGT